MRTWSGRPVSVQTDRRIVTVCGNTARVWNAQSGKPVGEPMGHEREVNAASFGPDGRRIVTVCDNTVCVWNAESGKPICEAMPHKTKVNAASFSSDGRRIVTASYKAARMWDAESGKPVCEPMPHDGLVNAASFSPSGRRIVTASYNELQRELLALNGDDVWSRFGRWFFMRGPQRTISPDSKVTVGELDRLRAAAEADTAKEPAQSEPNAKTKPEN